MVVAHRSSVDRHEPHLDHPQQPLGGRAPGDLARSGRVPAREVAAAIDRILAGSPSLRPFQVYGALARRSGVHPTTVLRVHRRNLATASAAMWRAAEELRREIALGGPVPSSLACAGPAAARGGMDHGRCPAAEVRRRIDAVLELIGAHEQQYLYRHLADQIGVHVTTVLRYHQGTLRSAPVRLLGAVDELQRRIESGDTVPFHRSPRGPAMVQRHRTRELLDELVRIHGDRSKAAVLRQIERRIGAGPGTVARIYYDGQMRWVPAAIHRGIEQLARRSDYDPCRTYHVGDHIRHHMFGLGVVVRKVHKDKILVEFTGDRRITLAEAVPPDPFINMRHLRAEPMYGATLPGSFHVD